jgi:hypothetical protein
LRQAAANHRIAGGLAKPAAFLQTAAQRPKLNKHLVEKKLG